MTKKTKSLLSGIFVYASALIFIAGFAALLNFAAHIGDGFCEGDGAPQCVNHTPK
jgi:hypothetical protein